jgi:hypothetical protein
MAQRTPLALFVLAALTAGPAWSQSPARKGVIEAPVVEVRSGPSPQMPATGRLQRGETIEVLREEQGFLAITPPAGSVSWIADRFLDVIDPSAELRRAKVIGDVPVPVRLGETGRREPLGVKQVDLQPGTIVVVTGPKVTADGTTWWPIQPPASEVRYVPKEAVSMDGSLSATTAQKATGKEEPLLWTQAEQAEKAGNFGEAMQLYRKLAAQAAQPGGDQEMSLRCYNRIAALQERLRQVGVATAGATEPTTATLAARTSTASAGPPQGPARNPAPAAAEQAYVGVLQRTNVPIDGVWAHALADNRGYLLLYVVGEPGVNLDYYVGHRVEVIGQLVDRKDLRGSVMAVRQVSRPR